jgi:hypothetical protein
MKTTPNGERLFVVIDTATNEPLATLPLTIPIGSTIEAYERAGYSVRWTWGA